MKLAFFHVSALLCLFMAPSLALAADPIYNVIDQPVSRADGKLLTEDDVRRALVSAGSSRGWVMTPQAPGVLIARLNVRKHMAEARIDYSPASFSITYQNSSNLDYGTNRRGVQVIHKNYNRWINNLRNDAVIALSAKMD